MTIEQGFATACKYGGQCCREYADLVYKQGATPEDALSQLGIL